jgi:hydroxyacylglutathione hydrolase
VLRIHQIPVWQDNYAYLVAHGDEAVVVDPPEAAPVLERARALGVTVRAVLCTHHHADHVGGNEELAAAGCTVIGAAHDAARIPALSQPVTPGESVHVIGLSLRVLDVRAHTSGHIAYALDRTVDVMERFGHSGQPTRVARLEARPALFVGDALFQAGCGRLFEGSAADLHASLTTLAREDPRALIVCAHEYTSSNLAFAVHALPHDEAVRARQLGLHAERAASGSSVPSTLEEELATNPFLRALSASDPVEAVRALRAAKDDFRAPP